MPLQNIYRDSELLLLGGDTNEALLMLAQAVEQVPDDPEPHVRMGEICMSLGDAAHLQQAADHLAKAVALGETASSTHFMLMRIRFEQGNYPAAESAYEAALLAAPDDLRLHEWGVRLALAMDNTMQALTLVQAERSAAPDNFFWHRWEAELLITQDDLSNALQSLDTLIAQHRPAALAAGDWSAANWGAIHMQRGDVALRLGDIALAEADCRQAQALISNDPAITFFWGQILWARGDKNAARNAFQQALDSARPEVRFGLERQLDGIMAQN